MPPNYAQNNYSSTLQQGPTKRATLFHEKKRFPHDCLDPPDGPAYFTKKMFPPLSGGGIIILHVIRRHFLAAAVDPDVSLSTYSPRPMEVVP